MKDAERLLVEDAPGAFVYHPLVGQLQKPYRKGSWKDANKTGYTGAQWPGEGTLHRHLRHPVPGRRCARPCGRRDADRLAGIGDASGEASPSTPAMPRRQAPGPSRAGPRRPRPQRLVPDPARRGPCRPRRLVLAPAGRDARARRRERLGQDGHRDVHPADAAGHRPDRGGEIVVPGSGPAQALATARCRKLRGRQIGLIPQDPAASLNPLMTVGQHLTELLGVHLGMHGRAARERGLELLDTGRHPRGGQRASTPTPTSSRAACASGS